MMPFTSGPLIISVVTVRVLDRQPPTDAELVLQSRPLKDYDGPDDGDVWKRLGTVVEVTTKYNRYNGRYYLEPEARKDRKD